MARVRRRWCVVQTPVRRRGTILPRSATKPCRRRTSRYGIASIFSVQNLQTFLRRKNLPRPPGPPAGRGAPAGRPPPEWPPGPEWPDGPEDAPVSGALTCISSDIVFPFLGALPGISGSQVPADGPGSYASPGCQHANKTRQLPRQARLQPRWQPRQARWPQLGQRQQPAPEHGQWAVRCASDAHCAGLSPWPGASLLRPCAR
jgi:hypothetical protein